MYSLRSKLSTWFTQSFVPAFFPRVNPAMRWLLRSPLHPVASWYVVLVCFEGRRTGKRYQVPLAYWRMADDMVEAVTSPHGRWWRNLSGVSEAGLLLRGKTRRAKVEVVENDVVAITRALRSRDACRRLLVPVHPHDTILLRFRLLPLDAAAPRH